MTGKGEGGRDPVIFCVGVCVFQMCPFLTVGTFIKYGPRSGFAKSGVFICFGLVDIDRFLFPSDSIN